MNETIAITPPGKDASMEQTRRRLILLSPVVIILGGQFVTRTIGTQLGVWGWIPLVLGYWAAATLFTAWGAGRAGILRWLQPSQGNRLWALLTAVFLVAPAIPMLFPDTWRLFLQGSVWIPTLFFVLANPAIEEGYWRGLLLDAASEKYQWAAVLYSSTLFAINHLWMSILVIGARNPVSTVYQLIFGLLMSVVYLKTRSLRWPIFTHFLVNLLTPTVAIFLNLYIPGVRL